MLARQKSEQMKSALEEAKRKVWRQKEREKVNFLVDELEAINSEIERLRSTQNKQQKRAGSVVGAGFDIAVQLSRRRRVVAQCNYATMLVF